MTDFIHYRCRLCPWEKITLVGGGISFYSELRHCSSCQDVFPFRVPYPEEAGEVSFLCPCCREETEEWCFYTRYDLVEESDCFRRLSCPSCLRQSVHGQRQAPLHPIYLAD